jgi:hypothetical protein
VAVSMFALGTSWVGWALSERSLWFVARAAAGRVQYLFLLLVEQRCLTAECVEVTLDRRMLSCLATST